MKTFAFIAFCCCIIAFYSCNNTSQTNKKETSDSTFAKGTYGYDAGFLKANTQKVYELTNSDGAKVLLSADYQGRVMTSTATGDSGISYGWLNYDLISAKEKKQQFNPFGGEERFWLGPEGGQYALYFKGSDSFAFNNWQVPASIDKDPFQVLSANKKQVTFFSNMELTNYAGYMFELMVNRTVTILNKDELSEVIHATIPDDVHSVGFETLNKVTNESTGNFKPDSGLISIWLLGMFTPSPQTKVIIPFKAKANDTSFITTNYFGNIPAERLKINDSTLFFTCDGKYRSKIGISPAIAKPMAASYDFEKNVLTILIPEIHNDQPYVNSKWEHQKDPYKGDVINSYNDGPLDDGSQMGPFYEIESSSPALKLNRGQSATYKQTICHLQGNYDELNKLAQKVLHVNLNDVKQ